MQAVSDLLALCASHGIDAGHHRFVVVLHAATTELTFDDAYAPRRAGHPNPSVAAMRELAAAGVRFVVSEQSMTRRGIQAGAIQRFVRIGPTANVVFIDLEAEGYVFTSTTSLARK